MIDVVLPLPPSMNNAFVNAGKRGRVKSADYRAWAQTAGWFVKLKAAGQKNVAGPFEVKIAVPMKMRGDIDNRAKGLIDLLVASGKVDDDRHLHKLTIWRDGDVEPGTCRVIVTGFVQPSQQEKTR